MVMANQEITVIIHPDGTVEMEGHHYQGAACDADLRALAESLGQITRVDKTPEYFQSSKRNAVTSQTAGEG
jgi:hypothetical protein